MIIAMAYHIRSILYVRDIMHAIMLLVPKAMRVNAIIVLWNPTGF